MLWLHHISWSSIPLLDPFLWGGHGPLNLTQAIARSCDIFFYEMAQRLGIQKLLPFYGLGLGQSFLTNFADTKTGLVPTPAWKLSKVKRPWTPGDSILTCIGHLLTRLTALLAALFIGTNLLLAILARYETQKIIVPVSLPSPPTESSVPPPSTSPPASEETLKVPSPEGK